MAGNAGAYYWYLATQVLNKSYKITVFVISTIITIAYINPLNFKVINYVTMTMMFLKFVG